MEKDKQYVSQTMTKLEMKEKEKHMEKDKQ